MISRLHATSMERVFGMCSIGAVASPVAGPERFRCLPRLGDAWVARVVAIFEEAEGGDRVWQAWSGL
jgi:hypothetical protein